MIHYFENEKPFPYKAKEISLLVGKNIEFVLERNIDKSGRGYFSISTGKVMEQWGRNIRMENGDWYFWREIRVYRTIE